MTLSWVRAQLGSRDPFLNFDFFQLFSQIFFRNFGRVTGGCYPSGFGKVTGGCYPTKFGKVTGECYPTKFKIQKNYAYTRFKVPLAAQIWFILGLKKSGSGPEKMLVGPLFAGGGFGRVTGGVTLPNPVG